MNTNLSDARMMRGMAISDKNGISENEDGSFAVPSQTSEDLAYEVRLIEKIWVCERLKAVSTTPRGKGPRADKNVDGWIMSTIPIQVKGSDGVGYPEVERFETTMRNLHIKEGYIVAFSFSKPAYEEAFKARNQDSLMIDLLELEERSMANPFFPKRPEVHTVLKSNITNQAWGERT